MRIQLKTLIVLISPIVVLTALAYLQWAIAGLPAVSPIPVEKIANTTGPHGFPAWLRITHYTNLLFLILLIRSGLQILADHPRLYWNVHCTPGSEWLRLTPIEVPRDRVWTAKDELARTGEPAWLSPCRYSIATSHPREISATTSSTLAP